MEQPQEEIKEIRLFGEKSLREEAYRQKILKLEKEVTHLENLARDSTTPDSNLSEPEWNRLPAHVKELYYETLDSFNERAKKKQEFFEKKANEITKRLDFQTQSLMLNLESSFRQKSRWLFLSTLVSTIFLIILCFSMLFIFRSNVTGFYNPNIQPVGRYENAGNRFRDRLSYIRTALETQTKYHHQYEVDYLDFVNGTYIGEISIIFSPHNKWLLKNLSSDVVTVFRKYTGGIPGEISFMHNGKLCIKAYITESPQKIRLQYFY